MPRKTVKGKRYSAAAHLIFAVKIIVLNFNFLVQINFPENL